MFIQQIHYTVHFRYYLSFLNDTKSIDLWNYMYVFVL